MMGRQDKQARLFHHHLDLNRRKISLQAVSALSGFTVTEQTWSVPGYRIANYVASSSAATAAPLSDLSVNPINYYWVDGQDGRTVTCDATVTHTATSTTFPCGISAIFNVKRPTSTLTATTGTVAVDSAWGQLEIHFGSPAVPGISFSKTVTPPDGFSGSSQYWQRVTDTVRRRQSNGGAWYRLAGTNLLDTNLPYSSSDTTTDSPGQGLSASYEQVSISDQFTMWTMFKPSGTDSIWVPLRSLDWSWSGSATRTDTTWTLAESGKSAGASSDTSVFPEWTANVTGLTWVAE